MIQNQDLKNQALDALRGNWSKAVLAALVYFLIYSAIYGPSVHQSLVLQQQMQELTAGVNATNLHQLALVMQNPAYLQAQQAANRTSGLFTLLSLLVLAPLGLGVCNAFRKLLVDKDGDILRNMFTIGFGNYWHKVWGMLLMAIFIFLWSLLLIIPGIIKAFSYAMTPYILVENPDLSANEAIDHSRAMMKGHKFDLFWLYLSFLGWGILCLFTLGIGFLWLVPYMETAQAAFYEEVKAEYEIHGGLI